MKDKGVQIEFITLHVGLGTFRPVSADDVEEHNMHAEFYQMSEETAATLNKVRENGGRIISVGTTSTRTLETIAGNMMGNLKHQAAGHLFLFIRAMNLKPLTE